MADIKVEACRLHNETHNAEKIISRVSAPYLGEPTRYAVDKQGRIELLHDKYDKPSKGFEVKELRGTFERDKFEKNQTQLMEAASRQEVYRRETRDSMITKERHEDIKSRIGDYDSETQGLLKEAMQRTVKKENKKKVIKTPKFYIHSNHNHVK